MNIIYGIITSLFSSISGSLWKKSADHSKLPSSLFAFFGPIIGIFFIYSLVFLLGINNEIFSNYYVIFLLIIAGVVDGIGVLLEASIIKKVKISEILPYNSLDKIFIIIFGFILFYGNEGYTSFTTLFISILTIIIIVGFSIDIKKLKIEKNISLYILVKVFYAISTLIIGKILLDYTTLDVFAIIIFVYLAFYIIINLLIKKDFKLILTQSRYFYKYRIGGTILSRGAFMGGFFIIETSGLLVASLLSFIGIVFSVLSMKFILGDTPTKKQILLSIIVVILIGIGYYFK